MAAIDGRIKLEVCGVSLEGAFPEPLAESIEADKRDRWLENNVIPGAQLEDVTDRLIHLNEAVTGFSSGVPGRPMPGEPRPEFDPAVTTKSERIVAKAEELSMEERSLWRRLERYEAQGLAGLVDRRARRPKTGVALDPRVEDAIRIEAELLGEESDVANNTFRRRVAERLEEEVGKEAEGLLPPRSTFNKAVTQVLRRSGVQSASATARRSKLARPDDEFGHLEVERPGEFVAIDSTSLDVLAIDPATYRGVRVELTAAIDVYSRQIVAFCITPKGTLGADLALLLADVVSPAIDDHRWPSADRRPFVGVPEGLVLRAFDLPSDSQLQAKVPVKPGTVIVDRGRNYQSATMQDACRELGINVQSARPKRGSDKPWIERFFGTLNVRLLQHLPGYVGPAVANRGLEMEEKSTLFISELESAIGEWIVGDYHERPHEGLRLQQAPSIQLTPNQAFREGIARAGFMYVPRDPNLRLKVLPTEERTVGDEGVKLNRLQYDSKNLPRRVRRNDSPAGSRWPFKYDPRDLSRIWFHDNETGEWIELPWRYLRSVEKPFNHVALKFAREELANEGLSKPNEHEIERKLWEILKEIDDRIVEPSKKRKADRTTRLRAVRTSPAKPAPPETPDLGADDDDWPTDVSSLDRG